MKKINIIVLMIFLVACLFRVVLISQKDALFFDEVLNMTYSNHNEYYFTKEDYFIKNKAYTGKELKKKFLLDNASFSDVVSDIVALRKGTGDYLHTNLYYSCFRMFFAGVDNFNLNQYLFRAGLFNLILFSFSFFFMFKLLNMLFDNKVYTCVGLFIAFLNPASVSNTVFFREYQLQEFFLILCVYLGVMYYQNLKNNTVGIKDIVIISSVSALTCLSGYYPAIFLSFIFLILLFSSLTKQNIKILSCCVVLTLGLILLAYPDYFGFFFHKTPPAALGTASLQKSVWYFEVYKFAGKLLNYPYAIYKYICSNILLLYFIWLGFKCTKQNNSNDVNILNRNIFYIISLISLVWLEIVLFTCPYRIVRYVLPVIPLGTVILTYILSCLDSKKYIKIACSLLVIHALLITFNTFANVDYIKFSNIKLKKDLFFNSNKDLNVYIVSSGYKDKLAAFVSEVSDTQKYIFIDKDTPITDKHFYLISDTSEKFLNNDFKIKQIDNMNNNYTYAEITR